MSKEIKMVDDQQKLNAIFQCLEILGMGHITKQGKTRTVFGGRRFIFGRGDDRDLIKIEDLEKV